MTVRRSPDSRRFARRLLELISHLVRGEKEHLELSGRSTENSGSDKRVEDAVDRAECGGEGVEVQSAHQIEIQSVGLEEFGKGGVKGFVADGVEDDVERFAGGEGVLRGEMRREGDRFVVDRFVGTERFDERLGFSG